MLSPVEVRQLVKLRERLEQDRRYVIPEFDRKGRVKPRISTAMHYRREYLKAKKA